MREIKFRVWNKERKEMVQPHSFIDEYRERTDVEMMQYTGLKDKNGKEIYEGDIVSLDGNMTADDSFGWLPNGWIFGEDDRYLVEWDGKLSAWVLRMSVTYDPHNKEMIKYLNHARSLLIDEKCEIVGNVYENPRLL